MTRRKASKDKFLFAASLMLDNSIAAKDILDTVKLFGYSYEKISEAKALREEAGKLDLLCLKASGEQAEATENARKARNAAGEVYMRALKVARVAFAENVEAGKALLLTGKRKRDLASWLSDAGTFYENLLAGKDLLAAMKAFGWTEERIRSEYSLINGAVLKNAAQKAAIGKNRKALENRDACFDKLADWLSAYRKIVRIAMAGNPQRLESLGIVVKR